MPPVWRGDRVTMIDLDLDIERARDGEVTIVDEDEFAAHQVRLAYPRHVIESARLALLEASGERLDIAARVTRSEEPFAETGARWMRLAAAMS